MDILDSNCAVSPEFMEIPQYLSLPRQKASHAAPKGPPANEASFRSALEAGTRAFNDGHYSDALDRFLDAEHTAVQLSVD